MHGGNGGISGSEIFIRLTRGRARFGDIYIVRKFSNGSPCIPRMCPRRLNQPECSLYMWS